jgi:hypothetical protein
MRRAAARYAPSALVSYGRVSVFGTGDGSAISRISARQDVANLRAHQDSKHLLNSVWARPR